MKNIDIFLSEQKPHDVIIEHKVKLSAFRETFCFHCNGAKPSIPNIKNNKFSLYTIEKKLMGQMLDVSKMFIKNTDYNIAHSFLSYMSQCKYNDTNYKKHIENHEDIKNYITSKCNEKMKSDMRYFKNDASVIKSDNNETNQTCAELISKLLDQCCERFTNTTRICSVPLIKNDTINYFYTINADTISQTYLIKLILV
jgi:hypothetical protein